MCFFLPFVILLHPHNLKKVYDRFVSFSIIILFKQWTVVVVLAKVEVNGHLVVVPSRLPKAKQCKQNKLKNESFICVVPSSTMMDVVGAYLLPNAMSSPTLSITHTHSMTLASFHTPMQMSQTLTFKQPDKHIFQL